MNILLVCSSIGGGGAERVAANLADNFVSNGITTSIFYWKDKGEQSYNIDSRIHIFQSSGSSLLSRVFSLTKLLKTKNFDAVISFTDIPNIITFLAFRLASPPSKFIPSIHNDLKVRDKKLKPSLSNSIIRALHKIACQSANIVVVVSDGAKQSLADYYKIPSQKLVRIYNPVLQQNTLIRKPVPIGNIVKLAAAGRLSVQKNYILMLNAANLLKNKHSIRFHLSIFGDGELRDTLQQEIIQLGLENEVELKGFVPDLCNKLAEYDIFVLSSSWEGFGNVLVEALSAGLRVVSTNCPSGPAEVLCHGKFGKLVEMNNPQQLADAIVELSGNTIIFDDALLTHLEQFTVEHIANEYLALISDDKFV